MLANVLAMVAFLFIVMVYLMETRDYLKVPLQRFAAGHRQLARWGCCPMCNSSPPTRACPICEGHREYGSDLDPRFKKEWASRWDVMRHPDWFGTSDDLARHRRAELRLAAMWWLAPTYLLVWVVARVL